RSLTTPGTAAAPTLSTLPTAPAPDWERRSSELSCWFTPSSPQPTPRETLVLAPLPIGFAVFIVHLATIPITGTGINPARSFGAAVIFNEEKPWDDHWIFWVGPFVGAAAAAFFYQKVMRAGTNNAFWSFSNKGGS
ncbi:unnamed protein product, partial [Linum tenue]